MKLHVNHPTYEKGFPLEVMGIGVVDNGSVIELTDIELASMKNIGLTIPKSGDMFLFPEAKKPTKGDA